jgi:dihydrofolate synthase / folylpolyglutamate synthase
MKTIAKQKIEFYLNAVLNNPNQNKKISTEHIQKALFELGNPQQSQKIVNIAGTSGKGSTSTLLSYILQSQGFRTGLTVSPHIFDYRERIQVNSKLISDIEFVDSCGIVQKVSDYKNKNERHLGYFEFIIIVAIIYFAKVEVDYSILEVGLGGRLDATNFEAKDKLAVISSIGLDHTHILGDTLEEIAFEKSGIIQNNCNVVALSQKESVNQVFEDVAKSKNAKIHWLIPDVDFRGIDLELIENRPSVNFNYKSLDSRIRNFGLSLAGNYQAVNCSLAIRSAEVLAMRDGWSINWSNLAQCLMNINFIGRFEVYQIKGKAIIIDGAHNPQKMQSFISSLQQYYPSSKFNIILAIKKNKDYSEIVDQILKIKNQINSIVLTSFSDLESNPDNPHGSHNPAELEVYLKKNKFQEFQEFSAFKKSWSQNQNPEIITVATGSLHIVDKIYKNLVNK